MDIVNYIIRLFHIKSNKKKEVAKVVAEEEGLSPEDIKNFLERFKKHIQRTPEEEKNETLRQETEYNSPSLININEFLKNEEDKLLEITPVEEHIRRRRKRHKDELKQQK